MATDVTTFQSVLYNSSIDSGKMSDALNLYLKEMKISQKLFKMFGLDIFSEKVEINIRTFIAFFIVIFYCICEFYAIFTNEDNFLSLILSMLSLGYGVQV